MNGGKSGAIGGDFATVFDKVLLLRNWTAYAGKIAWRLGFLYPHTGPALIPAIGRDLPVAEIR